MPTLVEMLQKSFRGFAELKNLIEVDALRFHRRQHGGLHHLHGHDVNVAVS
jgi:hypothetical protein